MIMGFLKPAFKNGSEMRWAVRLVAVCAVGIFCAVPGAARAGQPTPLPPEPVHLMQNKTTACIDKTAGLKNGVLARLQKCDKKNLNQRFKLEPQRGDYFLIRSVTSGKCLGVASEDKKNGVPVQQWSCLGYDNQLWKRVERPGGWFALRAKHSEKCLDGGGGKKSDGVLRQNDCAKARAGFQIFRMIP
jgi:hypothetical protein